jgi:pilus assembly protein CpaC
LRQLALATALIVIMVDLPGVQAQTRPVANLSTDLRAPVAHQQIGLLVGRSTVLTTARPIQRVSLTTPEIADAMVTGPHEVLIHGKAPGTISLLVWSDTGRISSYDVVVRRDLGSLEGHLSQLFPDEAISVAANGSDVIIAGTVSSKYVVEKAAAVVVGYVENPENVVNLLRQQEQEGVGVEQIMLRVRFAEVSRTAVQELGASFFTDILGVDDYVGRITTQQFAAPDFDNDEGLVFSDFLNVLAFNTRESIGVVIKALETRGLLQSLAEPNLITQNATEATFLAGGEYPYPILQGQAGAVTIVFKEFGVRLAFTPTIVGPDRIHLKVAPEVSALDFANSITIEGFRVPALTTRRTETQVELRDGQTFAVAGLLDNTATETVSKIPGLGDIPILGMLFKSRAYQKSQTELVVMITPHIVRRDSTGVAPGLPNLAEPFLEPPDDVLPPPAALSPPDFNRRGVTATDAVAAVSPNDVGPSLSGSTGAVVAARAPEDSESATAIGTTLDPRVERERLEVERKQAEKTRKAEERLAREEAKRTAEEAKRAAKAEQKRLEVERKQAEADRKFEERQAREEAKRAVEEAKRAAKAEQKRLEVERKQAEEERKVAEKQAREEEKLAREEAKRAAEEAKRAAKAEQKRLEMERKQAEKYRKEEEKRALAQVVADAKRFEQEAKQAEKLAKRRAERQAELDRILAEFQEKINGAQRAIDEIDRERKGLEVSPRRRLVVPIGDQPEPDPLGR